ncbi:MAG TPA: hypothetical protein VFG69_14090 [Nannocystaceae bacterium]|nr:hypothetical protein [Nannocystaceae bacterium]
MSATSLDAIARARECVATIALVLGLVGACVQSGSVGSDTGRDADDDGIAATSIDDGSMTSETTAFDPYAVCDDIETTGEPFPDSCTPSPADAPCLQCIKLVCCGELLSCASYEACVCQIDCAEMAGPPDVCNDACAGSPGGCDLSGCGELECEQVCDGAG